MADSDWKQITAAVMILIAALLAISPSAKALMVEMSIEDLTGQADVILTGQVKEVESRRGADRTMIYTYTTLAVDRYIKGGAGGTLTIITEGGNVDGDGVWVEDMPEFSKNESMLVFLKRAGNNYSVAGLFQGKYDIEYGEVIERNGKRTSIDKFISRIEAAEPAPIAGTETPTSERTLPTAVAPTNPQAAPGFEMFFWIIGVLAVWRRLKK